VLGLILPAVALVALGSVLALAEASLSRVTRVRALMLQARGLRHADALVRIESDPTPHLNAVYLAVMFAQNGSAILVALAAERAHGEAGVTIASVLFTFLYFVLVEALSKSWGVLRSDRVALALAPFVLVLARVLRLPTAVLVGLARLVLPRGERHPAYEHDIRSLADVGHEAGAIEAMEREMIHSIFRFTDTIVREVMTPRPDVTALPASASVEEAAEAFVKSGYSRMPVHEGRLDDAVGLLHAKDVLRAARLPEPPSTVRPLVQPLRHVPESRPVSALLQEMRRERFHMALVVDEFGAVSGLVTLEDLLEEIVGEIEEEHDREEPPIVPEGPGRWRVAGGCAVARLNETIGARFPAERWDTVGGLLMGTLGRPPKQGDTADLLDHRLTARRVQGRRATQVEVVLLDGVGREASSEPA
jgi:CBS domain containing-hemolysin-like protein